jgi:hypothetical protein
MTLYQLYVETVPEGVREVAGAAVAGAGIGALTGGAAAAFHRMNLPGPVGSPGMPGGAPMGSAAGNWANKVGQGRYHHNHHPRHYR